jgi:tetratricopeptide (TPR) repeat protein
MVRIIYFFLYGFFLMATAFFIGCSPTEKLAEPIVEPSLIKDTDTDAKRRNASLFGDAVRERLKENDATAITLFEQALEADPFDHASMYELAGLYIRQGKFDQADELMQRAITLNPENPWYQIRIAQLHRKSGNVEAFTDVYRLLAEKHPTNPEYISELSTGLILQEKYDEAIQIYNQIEQVVGVNELLSLQKHSVYMILNEPLKAIHEIEKLAMAFPFESRYQAMLAEAYVATGDTIKALSAYKKISEIDPDDQQVKVALFEYYFNTGQHDMACEELKKVMLSDGLDASLKIQALLFWLNATTTVGSQDNPSIELIKGFIDAHPEDARGMVLMAEVFYNMEDYTSAKEFFAQSLSVDSSNYRVWENLLMTDLHLFRPEDMTNHGSRASDLFPEQPLPYYVNGIGLYQLKKYEQALKSFETGRKFVVNNDLLMAEFYSMMGEVNNKLSNFRASDMAYEKALIINPESPVVLNNYAYYLSLRGEKLEQAAEMARKAVEAVPDNESNLDTYAWVLYKQEKYEEALKIIEKALSLMDTENGTILEHSGDIYFKLGRKTEALEFWKRASATGEASEFIQKKIETGLLHE